MISYRLFWGLLKISNIFFIFQNFILTNIPFITTINWDTVSEPSPQKYQSSMNYITIRDQIKLLYPFHIDFLRTCMNITTTTTTVFLLQYRRAKNKLIKIAVWVFSWKWKRKWKLSQTEGNKRMKIIKKFATTGQENCFEIVIWFWFDFFHSMYFCLFRWGRIWIAHHLK